MTSSRLVFIFNYRDDFDINFQPDIEGKAAEIEKLNADAAKAVEAIQQLDADKKELEEKINELEKNIQKLAALVKSQGDGNNLFFMS